MDIREFTYDILLLASADDFNQNESKIEQIKPHLHDAFIACLKMGAKIEPAIKALDIIDMVCRENNITPMEFIRLSASMRQFYGLIDLK